MHFLCPAHRRQLLQYPDHKQCDIWMQWLNDAALYYETEQWREAVSYFGCAFDLCYHSLMIKSETGDKVTRLCLSAIYLANTLQHMKQADKADTVLAVSFRLLQCRQAECGDEEAGDLACILLDVANHAAFFHRYLNLPFFIAHDVCH